MTIETGDFIRINYTGRLEDGTVFDTTYEEVAKEHGIYDENARYESYVIVVGKGHVVEGLDEDIDRKIRRLSRDRLRFRRRRATANAKQNW